MRAPQIGDLGLLSDCQGSALVSMDGTVVWACQPRFDSAPVFSQVLDPAAGHWALSPSSAVEATTRVYVPDTMVIRTEHRTGTGSVAVFDALALGRGEEGHRIGHESPHVLLRVVEGLEGHVDMVSEVAPRPEFGLTVPVWVAEPGGLRSRGGPVSLVLSCAHETEASGGTVTGHVRVGAGERIGFALRVASPWDPDVAPLTTDEVEVLLADTITGWQSWAELHGTYDGRYAEQVRLGGRVLQALTFAPTGAVVAAPTTSLPERIGGDRNWDYRYAWVRDASLTLQALWVAACPDEADAFFRFFATAAGGEVDGTSALQILYGVGGERHVPESTLGHLAGHRNSSPVRVGNGAWDQLQLDVYGELLDAACQLADQVGVFGPASAGLLIGAADTAARRWREPDEGIWEVRGGRQHFLYSKLMCWVALDRACRLSEKLGAEDRVAEWTAEAAEIREAILRDGWNPGVGAFTQAFGSDHLDASTLMIPIVGFLPAEDPRVVATVEAVAAGLTDGRGFVYRYRSEDGLVGTEGTFTICTFWLAQCLALIGQLDRARSLFEAVADSANDLGLMAEQVDPDDGTLLGNFPQAFTHIGLINAAWAIDQAERADSSD
ncbi:MAG: glycoside hydrolase family 15 protein [Acidimicrobiales bacterium]